MTLFRPTMILAAILLLAGAAFPACDAAAAGSTSSTSGAQASADQRNIERGKQAIEAGDWERAVTLLERAAAAGPDDADVFNLLAYGYRHLGRLDDAFDNYGKALALDPRHLGAHEYIGEAYLMIGDLAKAREHLAVLEELCGRHCEETEELAEAIARVREGEGQGAAEATE